MFFAVDAGPPEQNEGSLRVGWRHWERRCARRIDGIHLRQPSVDARHPRLGDEAQMAPLAAEGVIIRTDPGSAEGSGGQVSAQQVRIRLNYDERRPGRGGGGRGFSLSPLEHGGRQQARSSSRRSEASFFVREEERRKEERRNSHAQGIRMS